MPHKTQYIHEFNKHFQYFIKLSGKFNYPFYPELKYILQKLFY